MNYIAIASALVSGALVAFSVDKNLGPHELYGTFFGVHMGLAALSVELSRWLMATEYVLCFIMGVCIGIGILVAGFQFDDMLWISIMFIWAHSIFFIIVSIVYPGDEERYRERVMQHDLQKARVLRDQARAAFQDIKVRYDLA